MMLHDAPVDSIARRLEDGAEHDEHDGGEDIPSPFLCKIKEYPQGENKESWQRNLPGLVDNQVVGAESVERKTDLIV